MPEQTKSEAKSDETAEREVASDLPPEARRAIETIRPEEAKGLLSIFLARSTTTFGPDPETAKILAQAEMHEEECRLKGYQASLQNKELQSQRDHALRMKRLNHETAMQVVVLIVAVIGIGVGLYLSISGNALLGSNILVASVLTMLYIVSGKTPLSRGPQT